MQAAPRARRGALSRSAEFERVYRQGRSHGNRYLVLYAFPRGASDDEARASACRCRARSAAPWSATASSACCARRSRAERRSVAGGHDVVVVARPDARELAEREGLDGVRAARCAELRRRGEARAAA